MSQPENPAALRELLAAHEQRITRLEGRARLLRVEDVCAQTGLSRTTIYRLERDGRFPRRVEIAERSSGWLEDEVQAFIAERIAASRARQGALAGATSEAGAPIAASTRPPGRRRGGADQKARDATE